MQDLFFTRDGKDDLQIPAQTHSNPKQTFSCPIQESNSGLPAPKALTIAVGNIIKNDFCLKNKAAENLQTRKGRLMYRKKAAIVYISSSTGGRPLLNVSLLLKLPL